MATPLFLLGLSGMTTLGGGAYLNRAALSNPELKPEIGGMDARKVTSGVGLAMMLLGGPVFQAVGVGLAASGLLNIDTTNLVKNGLEAFIQANRNPAPAAEPPPMLAAPVAPGFPGPAMSPAPVPAPGVIPGVIDFFTGPDGVWAS